MNAYLISVLVIVIFLFCEGCFGQSLDYSHLSVNKHNIMGLDHHVQFGINTHRDHLFVQCKQNQDYCLASYSLLFPLCPPEILYNYKLYLQIVFSCRNNNVSKSCLSISLLKSMRLWYVNIFAPLKEHSISEISFEHDKIAKKKQSVLVTYHMFWANQERRDK